MMDISQATPARPVEDNYSCVQLLVEGFEVGIPKTKSISIAKYSRLFIAKRLSFIKEKL